MIPEITMNSLKRYIEHRTPTGSFLQKVLENNLFEAIARADEENIIALKDIVLYIYNKAPSACWGSPEKVKEWLNN